MRLLGRDVCPEPCAGPKPIFGGLTLCDSRLSALISDGVCVGV